MYIQKPHENKIIKEIKSKETFADSITRGDVFLADLNPVVGSEEGGIRPVVIIQNDIGNKHSLTTIAVITSKTDKNTNLPHVKIKPIGTGLQFESIVLLEQLRTIDKTRLIKHIGHLNQKTISKIEIAIKNSLGIKN